MAELIGAFIMLAGAMWALLGILGLLRFSDIYTRLHGIGLATTGGVSLLLIGAAVSYSTTSAAFSLLAIVTLTLVLFTSPLATKAMIKAAHRAKTPARPEAIVDELRNDLNVDKGGE